MDYPIGLCTISFSYKVTRTPQDEKDTWTPQEDTVIPVPLTDTMAPQEDVSYLGGGWWAAELNYSDNQSSGRWSVAMALSNSWLQIIGC